MSTATRSIRTENNKLKNAAVLMAGGYGNNKELTAFTQLDRI
jgi:hypothetical protein